MITKGMWYVIIAGFLLINFSGCTILGYMAGNKLDSKKAKVRFPAHEQLARIKTKSPVKILLRDYQLLTCRYQGLQSVDTAEYRCRYESARGELNNDITIPSLNDTVIYSIKIERPIRQIKTKYLFAGFDLNSLCFSSATDHRFCIENIDDMVAVNDRYGNNIDLISIKNYMELGKLPYRSEVVVQSVGAYRKIPGENIFIMDLPGDFNYRILLTAAGVVLDFCGIFALLLYSAVN